MLEKFYIPDDPNFKQHVNIDEYAWETIINDMIAFTNMPEKVNHNGYFNRIIINCCRAAKFNLTYRINEMKQQFNNLIKENMSLQNPSIAAATEQIRDAFIEKQISELNNDLNIHKGHQFHIKLQMRAKDYISLSEESRYFEGHLGRYLKFIFEEYAKLPNIEREQLYFLEAYEKIRHSLENSLVMKINVNGRIDIFIPYCIRSDNNNMFNYVAGFWKHEDQMGTADSSMKVTSYRLSNINVVEQYYGQKYKLTKFDKNMIETAIKKKEIRFLFGEINNIKIRMTEEGVKKYRYIIHQRPKYHYVHEEDSIYEFRCTERQIINYFFKFGKDAVVIEPKDLTLKMNQLYRLAVESYSNLTE